MPDALLPFAVPGPIRLFEAQRREVGYASAPLSTGADPMPKKDAIAWVADLALNWSSVTTRARAGKFAGSGQISRRTGQSKCPLSGSSLFNRSVSRCLRPSSQRPNGKSPMAAPLSEAQELQDTQAPTATPWAEPQGAPAMVRRQLRRGANRLSGTARMGQTPHRPHTLRMRHGPSWRQSEA